MPHIIIKAKNLVDAEMRARRRLATSGLQAITSVKLANVVKKYKVTYKLKKKR